MTQVSKPLDLSSAQHGLEDRRSQNQPGDQGLAIAAQNGLEGADLSARHPPVGGGGRRRKVRPQTAFHQPVLLQEVVGFLEVKPGRKYVDATVGGGGHASAILEKGGVVLGIDTDPEAVKETERVFQGLDCVQNDLEGADLSHHIPECGGRKVRPRIRQGNFKDLKEIAKAQGFDRVAGVLFDLGVSSRQLDTDERGFSYHSPAPLDMRMDPDLKVTAADLINGLGKRELYELFKTLGEEKRARTVARAVVSARQLSKIETCQDLARLVWRVKADPAKIFQALRIAVNDELNNLRSALPQALELLEPGGRLVVVAFHSLEDRIVKRQFRRWEREGRVNILTKKPIRPREEEVRRNKRARSAKLRAAVRMTNF